MNPTRREWLLSDAPQTRRQARLGAIYQGWLTFAPTGWRCSG